MRAGRFRHRVVIKSLSVTKNDTTGEVTEDWTDFARVRAAVEPMSGKEFAAADGSASKAIVRVIVRYRAGILPSMQVVHRERIYKIEAVLPDQRSGREYITLPCSEVVRG